MVDYVTLLGAEEVSRAGSQMKSAAEDMSRAAASISESVYRYVRTTEELIMSLERLATKIEDGGDPGG